MPELSVVDYILWALQRYIFKGERRFYEAVEHQVASVIDLYEGHKVYDSIDLFRVEKGKPLV